jgi:excisionase family DNA binding protein
MQHLSTEPRGLGPVLPAAAVSAEATPLNSLTARDAAPAKRDAENRVTAQLLTRERAGRDGRARCHVSHDAERDDDERLLLSSLDAARRLSISPRTLARLVAAGHIKSVEIGTRRLFDPRDLRQFIEQRKAVPVM